MKKDFKEFFLHKFEDIPAYGLNHLAKSRTICTTLLWVLFIISSSIICIKLTNDSLLDYLRFDTITKISQVYEQPSRFPTLTFCSKNSLKDNDFKAILKSCFFGFDSGCYDNPDRYFELFDSYVFKFCFRFNTGKAIPLLYSLIGGRDDSFFISLDFNQRFYLWIHNYSKTPKLASYLDGDVNRIVIGDGLYTVINIEKTVVSRQPKPYNDCYKNVSDFDKNKTIIEYFNRMGEPYNQADCINLCFDLDYIENKPCVCNSTLGNVWMDCYYGYENKNESGCTYKYRYKFSKEKMLEKYPNYCPEECNSIYYSTSVNIDIGDDKLTKIRIFFKTLKYTFISEEPKYQIFDLISKIGGIFGLLIGLSCVTFLEIFDLIFDCIVILFKMKIK